MLGYRSILKLEKEVEQARQKTGLAKELLKKLDSCSVKANKIAFEASFEAAQAVRACDRCRRYLYKITKDKRFKKYYNYDRVLKDLFEDLSYIKEEERDYVTIETAIFHVNHYCKLHVIGYQDTLNKIYKKQEAKNEKI